MLRREDARLLTGGGQYVSDLNAPGLLVAAILRSPHAHARIRSADLSAARACPGVLLALSGGDLAEVLPLPDASANSTQRWLSRVKPRLQYPRQRALALDEVHYVGQPEAVAVAHDRYAAEDALDVMDIEYEPLPAAFDLLESAAPGAALAHEELSDNLLFEFRLQKGEAPEAPHRLKRRFRSRRNAAVPMEGRGALAIPDVRTGRQHRFDWIGVLLSSAALFAVVFGLIEGQRYDWSTITGWITTSSLTADGTMTFNGTCTLDMGDGTAPVGGLAFVATVGAAGVQLTVGTTVLPFLPRSDGWLSIE